MSGERCVGGAFIPACNQSVVSYIRWRGGGCMGIVVVQPLYDNFNEIREFVRAAVVVVELGLELNIYLTHPQVTVYKILV